MHPGSSFLIAPNWLQIRKPKFHVSIITGSGVIAISFFKGLTRNSEIRDTPV